MGHLLSFTIPLALAAAVSPIVFLLQVATLSGDRRLAHGAAFAGGNAVSLTVFAVLVLLLGAAISLHTSPRTEDFGDVLIGLLLLGVGAHEARRGAAPAAPSPHRAHGGLWRSFALGAGAMATNFTTIALLFPAFKEISASDVAAADKAIVTALDIVITLSISLVPLGVTALAPDASGRVLTRIGELIQAHSARLAAVVGLGFGAFLVIRGLVGLA